MTSIFRVVAMSAVMAAASWGATIQISGTLLGGSGSFSFLEPGTLFSGTVEITGSGPDTDIDEPNENGQFDVTVGRIDLVIGSLLQLTYSAGNSSVFQLTTFEGGAGPDQVYINSFIDGLGSAGIFLFGTDELLTPPAGVDGETALSGINWSAFTGGSMNISIVDRLMATSESEVQPAVEFGESFGAFSIDSAQAVPEPGTVFAVAAGGLVLWLKRRQSR